MANNDDRVHTSQSTDTGTEAVSDRAMGSAGTGLGDAGMAGIGTGAGTADTVHATDVTEGTDTWATAGDVPDDYIATDTETGLGIGGGVGSALDAADDDTDADRGSTT